MKSLTMFWISILIFISSPCVIHSQPPGILLPIKLKLHAIGPEDVAFNGKGEGPYTGVADGRILKYYNGKFIDFATTSPLRTKVICDGTNNTILQLICGRPLGLEFHPRTGDLYIADVNFGLLKVGPKGGLATQLAAGVNGIKFSFTNAVALDESTVYFVDSGLIFLTGNFTKIAQSGDTSGRLLKYEMETGRVTVVLRGLSGPAGLAISKDKTFLLISEFIAKKITKYIIKGPKANTTQTLLKLEGQPDNVKRATSGGYWVAVNILKPPQPQQLIPMTESIAVKFDRNGKILDRKNVTSAYPNSFSAYLEHFGKAYTGSLVPNFLGVYTLK
ncbi:PREDICTED: protein STRICTOSIDINE SYNTHASE-LIKE 3-like [Ipomoea nil]|uniref:protein STRICTOSIDINE SYNTHASE-LIKE 3-like n=1 Tax=Ipomoea nil TaxID=35883 RepID=UPI00090184F1|nr:PREDICTED: protein STRICTOSIDINE SYNTHASE-LIKE 3-like [Ipomoea nil]